MILNKKALQPYIIFFICLPIFFQLNGQIFNSKDWIFFTHGQLLRVPLPISIISCYLGVFFLLRYTDAKLSIFFVCFFTCTVIMSTLVISFTDANSLSNKSILLIQFILPTFAIILGQSYQDTTNTFSRYESVFFYVVAIIVPIEVMASWFQGKLLLTPYLYLFSIHQHMQYVPTIMVSLYFLSIPVLYQKMIMRRLVLLIAPFIGIYSAASLSTTASLIALTGPMLILVLFRKKILIRFSIYLLLLMVIPLIFYSLLLRSNPTFEHKFLSIICEENRASHGVFQSKNQALKFPNVNQRLYYWDFYLKGLIENPKTLFFGHNKLLERKVFPSAHNYYLDLVYNFGLITLIPFLILFLVTAQKIFKCVRAGPLPMDVIALALLICYFILVENTLKVGFRQPYPGIITFFLWGVLLTKLNSLTIPKEDTKRMNSQNN